MAIWKFVHPRLNLECPPPSLRRVLVHKVCVARNTLNVKALGPRLYFKILILSRSKPKSRGDVEIYTHDMALALPNLSDPYGQQRQGQGEHGENLG
ncbi:hypothetical protein AMTR_s00086p00132360 [Amborella trichopoda]|uniref:Uncharacterized protein n=1 Tax=Amborella trichopoda TaxID=13333 RepID=W1P4H4_AMBTC|nr:hypothetical protein AMTR_s00086p00132360 [Amborella trichopoda]